MQNLFTAFVVTTALLFAPATSQANVLGLFGFDCCGGHNHGCAQCGNCGTCCEPACGCGGCGECCEPACGCTNCCEPACGCGTGCFPNGRQFAGQCFDGCCESRAPICCCRDCGGCGDCCGTACGGCCEPACGCGECCEPTCGCGGCGDPCGAPCRPRSCCLKHVGFGSCCGHLINGLCCCKAGCGCNGEVYWSEWHNDPPCCQDPCDCYGQYNGPRAGCYGGCNTGAYGCNGGYASSQSAAVSNGAAYAKQQNAQQRTQVASNGRQFRPANQTRLAGNNHNQQMVASRNQQQQQQQFNANVRTAARPMPNRVQSAGGNYYAPQQRPIMW